MLDLAEIKQLSVGLDEHLRRLESFTPLLREIKSSLDEILHAQETNYLLELGKLRREVENVNEELGKRGLPLSSEYELKLQSLKEMLNSEDWPQALDSEQICFGNTEKKVERANNILDLFIGEHLKDKKFLDYGCGSGEVVFEASKREAKAFGYDIDPDQFHPHELLSSDFEEIRKHAPFDVILVHDVLDHIEHIDPLQALLQIKELLSPQGKVYVRNHPWSSRHGGHLYNTENKAFMHLIFDEMELTRIGGYSCDHNICVMDPIGTYRHWFSETGFDVKEEFPICSKVEKFFTDPSPVFEKLKSYWPDSDCITNILEIDFVEYILESKDQEMNII